MRGDDAMSGGKGTPQIVLAALYNHLNWQLCTTDYESIRYEVFVRVLMNDSGMFGTERTCKDKWKLLIKFGYFNEINQHACTVDMSQVRKKLEVKQNTEVEA
jgi:hypothetical protein